MGGSLPKWQGENNSRHCGRCNPKAVVFGVCDDLRSMICGGNDRSAWLCRGCFLACVV